MTVKSQYLSWKQNPKIFFWDWHCNRTLHYSIWVYYFPNTVTNVYLVPFKRDRGIYLCKLPMKPLSRLKHKTCIKITRDPYLFNSFHTGLHWPWSDSTMDYNEYHRDAAKSLPTALSVHCLLINPANSAVRCFFGILWCLRITTTIHSGEQLVSIYCFLCWQSELLSSEPFLTNIISLRIRSLTTSNCSTNVGTTQFD